MNKQQRCFAAPSSDCALPSMTSSFSMLAKLKSAMARVRAHSLKIGGVPVQSQFNLKWRKERDWAATQNRPPHFTKLNATNAVVSRTDVLPGHICDLLRLLLHLINL